MERTQKHVMIELSICDLKSIIYCVNAERTRLQEQVIEEQDAINTAFVGDQLRICDELLTKLQQYDGNPADGMFFTMEKGSLSWALIHKQNGLAISHSTFDVGSCVRDIAVRVGPFSGGTCHTETVSTSDLKSGWIIVPESI